ncbi:Uncharacterised protein [Vibrio cholerae]|nr:Uncharacterised protein [Vibrio cholerae]CSC52048.1 Uncharacterised protein [Vibrio cholerae]CSD05345.1 Uncharacterised protein [Vibrio cholerae]CSD36153.1 Uncharacterised protein [Vibrio cholerae]
MSTSFLSKVSKSGHDRFFTNRVRIAAIGILGTKCREFANRTQETGISVFRCRHVSEEIPLRLRKYAFNPFHVIRVCRQSRLDRINNRIGAGR